MRQPTNSPRFETGDEYEAEILAMYQSSDAPRLNFYRPAIAQAVEADDREALTKLLAQESVDVDERDFSFMTALMLAVWFVREAMCQQLISAGADINAQTRAGRTVLDIAILTEAKKPNEAAVAKRIKERLISLGAKPLLYKDAT